MDRLTEWLVKPFLDESVDLPIEIGDTVKMGKFKNKKVVIKKIDWNEKGDLLINGRPALKFRLMPKTNIFDKEEIKEGINDPGILKCVFLAGGPGAGKTYMTKGLFGIPERLNISKSGMKMVNSDKELKYLLKKYGFGTDLDKMPDEVFQDLTAKGKSGLRDFGKELTTVRRKKYMDGRLGIIIDGTGDDYKKIAKLKKEVEEVGYDTYMIFINTTLEVALQRNEKRDRVLPEKIVRDSHRDVMKNLGGFNGLFKQNFMIADNNKDLDEKKAIKRFNMLVKQGLNKFIKTPIKNPIGKSWIRKQKLIKKIKKNQKGIDPITGNYIESIGLSAGGGVISGAPSVKKVNKVKKQVDKQNKDLKYTDTFSLQYLKEFSANLVHKPKMKKALQKLIDKNLLPKNYAKNISKLQHFLTQNPLVMTQLLRLLGENINEQKEIKKVVGIYGGRFQPFGPHHKKVYEWMKKQFDDVYITTSDIKRPPKHPMNFKEKKRHMLKMGIPSNKIVKERTPYVAKNTLKKFDGETTAVIYIFGEKDADRLSGGTKKGGGKTYYQDYKKNKNKMSGYEEHGYIHTAPHVSMRVGGMEVSGTAMRQLLGAPKYADDRERRFKKFFGYFDQGVYNMMTNKFGKLYGEDIVMSKELIQDFLIDVDITKLLKESTINTKAPIDDGPVTYYKGFSDYKKFSAEWIDSMFKKTGWKVVQYMLSDKAVDPAFDYTLKPRFLPTPSYGTTGVEKITTGNPSYTRYRERINFILSTLGYEVYKWMGLDDSDMRVNAPILPGADKDVENTDLRESKLFSKTWWKDQLLVEEILEIDERMTLEEGIKFNNFLKDWAKKAKQPFDKVRKTMMNKNTFSIAKLNDFSVDKVFEVAKKGFKAYQKIINYVPDKIAKKLSTTKFGQAKEKYLVKLDDYLKEHPKLKRVMGIGAAAAVTYAWTKMTFIGDPEYDLDLSAAATAAATGDVSFADLFSGQMGTKFLVLTAVGAATGLTAPYVKAFGRVGTMAAGVGFGAYRAYKARKKRKADAEKKAKTSAPDTVKNPNPKGRKKTISRRSAVQWVAKNKGDKAAKKYASSLSERINLDEEIKLILEDDVVKNKQTGSTYVVKTHNPNTQDLIKKNASDKEIGKVKTSPSKERIKTIKSWGKDPHGNLFLGDDKVGYSKEVHKAQYVTETENSMVIGTPHTEHDKKGKQFFEKNIVPMVEKFIEDNKGEKIIFLAEGGQGDGHNYWPNSEQEAVGEIVKNYDKGEVDTWDGKYNKHDEGHKEAPIYKDLAEKMSGGEDETYTASDMTGAMYSNLVGQGDNGKEAMDSYLTEDGKQFLIDNGYKGSFPPKDKSEVKQLYDMNYPEDSGKEPGSNPVAKAQLAWNQLRRDNMDKKMKAYEDAGYKVLVVPGATHGSAIKAQSKKVEIKEHLLLEGGAYGHMAHPFDDNDLTFKDLKNIIELGLGGQLNREDNVTEKLDGQNLMISWRDGNLIAARNKGHLKNAGENALDTRGIISKFKGRGDIAKAFGFAMKDLEKAIGKLSDKQREKIFMNGKAFMNLEVMWPKSANVINYDKAEIVFHGALEYNDAGTSKGEVKGSGRMLQGMIRQVNQHIQKHYKIGKPVFLQIPKNQDFGTEKSGFISRLTKLQKEYALKDTDTLSMYHQMYWMEWIMNGANQTDFMNITDDILEKLTKRWAFFDKSYKIVDIRRDLKEDHPEFLEWVLSTDKDDHQKMVKENMKPFEVLFFEVGAEILKNITGYMAANPDSAVQRIRKTLKRSISSIKASKDPKKLKTLKLQLDKLKSIGGIDAIVPSEGIVFKYKGKTYKFTGAFAPINQILGLLTF